MTAEGRTPPSSSEIPIACVPGAIPAAERSAHFQLVALLFGTMARERRALSRDTLARDGDAENADGVEGYAYRFDAHAFDDVARWIANERLCCPFLTFRIELTPDGGPLWVWLTGPKGTSEFLDAEIPAQAGLATGASPAASA